MKRIIGLALLMTIASITTGSSMKIGGTDITTKKTEIDGYIESIKKGIIYDGGRIMNAINVLTKELTGKNENIIAAKLKALSSAFNNAKTIGSAVKNDLFKSEVVPNPLTESEFNNLKN